MCRYDSGGAAAGVTTLTSGSGGGGGKADRRITLAMIKDEGLGTAGANAWVQVCALIVYTPSCRFTSQDMVSAGMTHALQCAHGRYGVHFDVLQSPACFTGDEAA